MRTAAEKKRMVILELIDDSSAQGVVEDVTEDLRVKLWYDSGVDFIPIKEIVNVSVLLSLREKNNHVDGGW
ncbi:hypothetical protein ACFPYJ_19380 [Paenibacillus solisilvae]|uniref:Uncharacterized protein n=1 Tax=Paenibacillus solisilvae TaxID=2486751 RepID=A0ABW0W2R5_9BACL